MNLYPVYHFFLKTTQQHSILNNISPPSLVSICTLLYAPKLCALDNPSNRVDWTPPPGFTNRRQIIEEVNEGIKIMNNESGVNYINLHFEGIRIDNKRGFTMHRMDPLKPIWREKEIRSRLHLNIQYKAKVAGKMAKLFMGGLDNMGKWE